MKSIYTLVLTVLIFGSCKKSHSSCYTCTTLATETISPGTYTWKQIKDTTICNDSIRAQYIKDNTFSSTASYNGPDAESTTCK